MPRRSGPQPSPDSVVPKNFPETNPATGPDLSMWLLKEMSSTSATLGNLAAVLANVREELARIETKVDKIAGEIAGQGKWIHTVKVILGAIGVLLSGIIIAAVGPWLKAKIFG